MQGEQIENTYYGYGNASSSEEIVKVRQNLCWRNERDQSDGSRRRTIANAKIRCAFIATEEEVCCSSQLANCESVKENVPLNPTIPVPRLEKITSTAYLSFLEDKCRRIF